MERKFCITSYLNGTSMRGIQKTLSIIYNKKIHIQNIVHWIKNADKILKEEIEERQKEVKSKEIKILEMDETRRQTEIKRACFDLVFHFFIFILLFIT